MQAYFYSIEAVIMGRPELETTDLLQPSRLVRIDIC